MLAISVREAIRDAVAAFGGGGGVQALPSPATSEAIFFAVRERLAADPREKPAGAHPRTSERQFEAGLV